MALELGILRHFAENREYLAKHNTDITRMLKFVFNKVISLYLEPFFRLLLFKFHLHFH